MMQVVLSIQAGMVLSSMLLAATTGKTSCTAPSANWDGLSEPCFCCATFQKRLFGNAFGPKPQSIESYNDFLDWIAFGGPIIKSGDPVEQAKQIKYMNLVANAVMLHNVADLTDVLENMASEGFNITKALVSRLSPYMREHIRRFGKYLLDMEVQPPPLEPRSILITA
jgi:hypothetical protein